MSANILLHIFQNLVFTIHIDRCIIENKKFKTFFDEICSTRTTNQSKHLDFPQICDSFFFSEQQNGWKVWCHLSSTLSINFIHSGIFHLCIMLEKQIHLAKILYGWQMGGKMFPIKVNYMCQSQGSWPAGLNHMGLEEIKYFHLLAVSGVKALGFCQLLKTFFSFFPSARETC